jgi:hypothetical protein
LQREKRIKEVIEITTKNGKRAIKGTCPTCATGMLRILGND